VNDLQSLEKRMKTFFKYSINEEDDLKPVIENGISRIQTLTGTEINFEENREAFVLLQNYVRYSINYAEEYFEENFHKEILRLSLIEGVKANET
jgi:hypothetical protein